jgi:hypothetical protein
VEFRCANNLHFKIVGNLIETKCRSKRCGAGGGNVVLHRFDLTTGELVETQQYKDPKVMFDGSLSEQAKERPQEVLFRSPTTPNKEEQDGRRTSHRAAVRSA